MKQLTMRRALAALALVVAVLGLAIVPTLARAEEGEVAATGDVALASAEGAGDDVPDLSGTYRVTFDYGDARIEINDGQQTSGFWFIYTDAEDLASKADTLNGIIQDNVAGTFYEGYTAPMLSGGTGTFLGWATSPSVSFDKVLEPSDFAYLESEGYYNLTVTARWGVESSSGEETLTSFKIGNGDISLDGVDAYQVRVPTTRLVWEANAGADFEVISVAVADSEVASAQSYTDQITGEKVWSVVPGVVGGTTTLTAVAVDGSNPNLKFEDTVTVTCTPGEGWVPAQDFTIGEDGVLTVPLSWADLGGYSLFDWDFMEAVYYDLSVTVDDPSVARVEGYGYSITPLKTGTTTITVTITDKFYGGTKSAKATLAVTDGPAMTVISNEQGATLSHEAKLVDDGFGGTYNDDSTWRELDLVTEWLGGEAASAAGDAINAAVSGVSSMYVYDIHLEEYGQVFEIPEGDSVTVTLPLPEGMEPDGVRVFHVADDGTVTDMGATVDAEARTVTFTTTHFSTFVLANVGGQPDGDAVPETKPAGEKNVAEPSDEAVPATGDAGSAAALLAAGSGAAALLGSRALRRRRG